MLEIISKICGFYLMLFGSTEDKILACLLNRWW